MYFDSKIFSRANRSIAQGALTNSKHADRFVKGIFPTHIKSGKGAYLIDESGNKFTDYICGLGTNLLGYGNPKHTNSLVEGLGLGFSHSLPTLTEIEAAETYKAIFPFVDRVKFLKTGTEACMAAVRIARAYHEAKGNLER